MCDQLETGVNLKDKRFRDEAGRNHIYWADPHAGSMGPSQRSMCHQLASEVHLKDKRFRDRAGKGHVG